jgi:hypothetical protein
MTGLHTTMVVAGFVALAGAAMGPLLRPTSPRQDGQAAGDESDAAQDVRDALPPQPEDLLAAGHGGAVDTPGPMRAE